MRLKSLNVLVVDDDAENLDLLSLCLASEGAHVLSAPSLASALVRIAQAPIDLVVCGLMLSDGDGCDLLQHLRAQPERRKVPAIALTLIPDREQWQELERCGFDGFAVIPVNLEDLVGSIVRLVRSTSGTA
ncbi:MAG TPA: response regulator [Polyangiaceae bacterium]|nr:response regulator [Polyangiaceae bacterium]